MGGSRLPHHNLHTRTSAHKWQNQEIELFSFVTPLQTNLVHNYGSSYNFQLDCIIFSPEHHEEMRKTHFHGVWVRILFKPEFSSGCSFSTTSTDIFDFDEHHHFFY